MRPKTFSFDWLKSELGKDANGGDHSTDSSELSNLRRRKYLRGLMAGALVTEGRFERDLW